MQPPGSPSGYATDYALSLASGTSYFETCPRAVHVGKHILKNEPNVEKYDLARRIRRCLIKASRTTFGHEEYGVIVGDIVGLDVPELGTAGDCCRRKLNDYLYVIVCCC